MYNRIKPLKTGFKVNNSYEGERLEEKINRIVNNKEPINDGAPQIFTDRKDGVIPDYDIRTDRFEAAVDAMDKVSRSMRAKRDNNPDIGKEAIENMKKEDGGAKPIQGTENK